MPKLGVNRDDQKRTNQGLILKLVATGQCTSRIELSKTTGLTKTAISQIVNELMEKNFLSETEKKASHEPGRNQIGLMISPKAPHVVGILIQRRNCQAVLCDMCLHIVREHTISRDFMNEEELLDTVYQLADEMLEGEDNVAGIGVSAIGSVDSREGIILRPYYFHGIENVQIRKLLEERYQLPVAFDHDNQSAVLAEHLYGNGRGYEDILMVSLGRGVGCGVLVDGKKIQSHTGFPPEIGHTSINYNGPACVCGNRGCLEMYVNTEETLRRFQEATGITCTYEEFCKMDDNPQMDEIMCDTVEKLGSGISNSLNILNSELVLLCLNFIYWPGRYVRMLEEDVNRKKYRGCEKVVPVRKASFMERAQVIGAACNMVNMFFAGKL